eukprot:CAMPEP_0181340118 /NCGR_PEP_ID=MMETSP1101-20121128/29659_1 /TAXON_ID=46948 /ORGANISM="Rhodomonas abbreviata, Strain Caron Lab Isolate" /LENGTH=215 /DNA_ID=CAMNT_0023451213 /DNA_START=37 /DNA_END=681 /DNA_ORIENTATION=+
MLRVGVAALFVIIATCESSPTEYLDLWADISRDRIERWFSHDGLPSSTAQSLRAHVFFAEELASFVQKYQGFELENSLVRYAESVLAVYRELLEDMDHWFQRGQLPDVEDTIVAGLRKREVAWREQMETAQELVSKSHVNRSAAESLLSETSARVRAVFDELESLFGTGRVPQDSFGISAKFHESGQVAAERFHFAFQLWGATAERPPTHAASIA